jgi:hypothetical protein
MACPMNYSIGSLLLTDCGTNVERIRGVLNSYVTVVTRANRRSKISRNAAPLNKVFF